MQRANGSTRSRKESLIVLVRHGHAGNNEGAMLSSDNNAYSLTSSGIAQSKAVTAELRKLKLDIIVSSQALRARQTSGYIAIGTGLGYFVTDPRLNERNFGQLEGTKADGYNWRFVKDRGVETYWELLARSSDVINDCPSGVIVAVTHGDVMRAPVLDILGLDETSGFGVRNYNANMNLLHVLGGRTRLIGFGLPILADEVLQRIPGQFRS
ncbi:MAG: histidine phosphatase family protein [Candidatus Micrarchaeota archaeon]|nr:histidine phosphatase family protein [Candidatus Micrarchaeota archaeon]MDE1834690.1 histidine phosphatase family protein [Candidatus Micrarchaeota archaeon]MDE1859302.1 histidine phosphatase family protein [Candidatus Micrarchaeota archaeon]